jgi:hypothetical protein
MADIQSFKQVMGWFVPAVNLIRCELCNISSGFSCRRHTQTLWVPGVPGNTQYLGFNNANVDFPFFTSSLSWYTSVKSLYNSLMVRRYIRFDSPSITSQVHVNILQLIYDLLG